MAMQILRHYAHCVIQSEFSCRLFVLTLMHRRIFAAQVVFDALMCIYYAYVFSFWMSFHYELLRPHLMLFAIQSKNEFPASFAANSQFINLNSLQIVQNHHEYSIKKIASDWKLPTIYE